MNASLQTTAGTAMKLEGVSKLYGPVKALDNISFELRKGEFLTMLGPSGSGKTTSLRAIAGFIQVAEMQHFPVIPEAIVIDIQIGHARVRSQLPFPAIA